MFRRALVIAAAAVLVAAQTGCRSQCGERRLGLFSCNSKSEAPCQTAGRSGGCFDATTGQPVPCPPGAGSGGSFPSVVPGGPRPDELHMPSPTDMISPPAVPFPAPAPPNNALLPLPTYPGTPVRVGPNH